MKMLNNKKLNKAANYLLAGVFIAYLFISFGQNFMASHGEIFRSIDGMDMSDSIGTAENIYDDNLAHKLDYINIYGGIQRLMQKNEVGDFDVVQDSRGYLHMGYLLESEPVEYDKATFSYLGDFSQYCEDKEIEFLCTMVPLRINESYTFFPGGITVYNSQNKAAKVSAIRENNVSVLDLDEVASAQNLDFDPMFFKTDHHWTTETAFWAFTALLDELQKRGLTFPNYDQITDLNNFEQRLYPESFVGSVGRRTGYLYSGFDDYTLIVPDFSTYLQYEGINGNALTDGIKEGTFEETLLYPFHLEQDRNYQANLYATYLGFDAAQRTIVNPDGENTLLIVHNSYGLPLTSFLSLGFHTTYTLDFRYHTDETLKEFIADHPDIDAVVVFDQFEPGFAELFE